MYVRDLEKIVGKFKSLVEWEVGDDDSPRITPDARSITLYTPGYTSTLLFSIAYHDLSQTVMTATESNPQALLRGLPSLKGPFRPLDLSTFPPSPQEAFIDWLKDAIDNDIKEPHAMTLSTIDEDGYPDARVLILKNLDQRGWHFAIKADSPKGKQILNNSAVALTFYWPHLGRQIRIRGVAAQLPAEESARDFSERPIGSKVTALASKQSEVLKDAEELQQGLRNARQKMETEPDYVSPAWTVFAVAARTVEFWQGATDRMHQRLRYKTSDTGKEWTQDVLSP